MSKSLESITSEMPPFRPELYSGTAASELSALHSPALQAIAQINQRVAVATQIRVLSGAHFWNEGTAKRWLAPLGHDLRIPGGEVTPSFGLDIQMPRYFQAGSLCNAGTVATIHEGPSEQVEESTVERDSPAFTAFKDLMRWLEATDQEVADMVGVGRTTPYTWSREGREPRRSTVRRLFQVHSVVAALVQSMGENAAIQWLAIEHPEHRNSLLNGNLDDVQGAIHSTLFKTRRPRVRAGTWIPDGDAIEQ